MSCYVIQLPNLLSHLGPSPHYECESNSHIAYSDFGLQCTTCMSHDTLSTFSWSRVRKLDIFYIKYTSNCFLYAYHMGAYFRELMK